MENKQLIVFGPVPSRRLGQSLGINNIPPKHCTFSCVYCQLGRTRNMEDERRGFYNPFEIVKQVEEKVRQAKEKSQNIDYLTFVADGEPTLDRYLGKEIEMLKKLGIKIAVITNSSLISDETVQNDLLNAHWVSLKIDAASKETWKKIDRPHGFLDIEEVKQGIREFADKYKGFLVTETMLVNGINDNREEIEKIADFIGEISPRKSYLSIPIRPPAEADVKPPSEEIINSTFQVFKSKNINVEYLIGYEGNEFASTGNVEEDLLSITSVHPMREDAVKEFLEKNGAEPHILKKMIDNNKMIQLEFEGRKFYMRKILEKR